MARLQAYLVGLWLCLLVAGCAPAHLGDTMFIQDAFPEAERPLVLDGIVAWNNESLKLTGDPAFYYGGIYHDPDGYHPLTDLTDGRNVIYRLDQPLDPEKTGVVKGGCTLGMAFPNSDVSIVASQIATHMYEGDKYEDVLRLIVTHELGHGSLR